jgi:hypothetical protein
MRHLLLATTLLAASQAAFAAGPRCAVAPSRQEVATFEATQPQTDPSVAVPAPVNPQAQANGADSVRNQKSR